MGLKVHHLTTATFCPAVGNLLQGNLWSGGSPDIIAHCLLIETNEGLVLVDTGFGLDDVRAPWSRFNWLFLMGAEPRFSFDNTAYFQIKAMGFDVNDVRHVITTHLDLDHAGGLPDFPQAKVHVHEKELQAAFYHDAILNRQRYSPEHWKHNPEWVRYREDGEDFYGFRSVKPLQGLPDDIFMIPLPGHSRGHCGVVVNNGSRWLIHCGDAYFHRYEIDPEHGAAPWGLEVFQGLVADDNDLRKRNQRRLRELQSKHADEVTPFCAHDIVEFRKLCHEH